MSRVASVEHDLRAAVTAEIVPPKAEYLTDQTEARGLTGRADAVALPRSAEEVAEVVAWCYERGVAVVPRGGGTGYAAGAVPLNGGVVLSLERLARVRSFDPLLWRMEVEAGVTTANVRRVAREGGLLFAPDPGAAEQSQIGGNIATNAGGPHAYKYGVTGAWVLGLEAVVAPGEVVRFGGPVRKDVAGYDLKHLLVGSEGTLGVITSSWLRLTPAPEAAWPVIGVFDGVRAGATGSRSSSTRSAAARRARTSPFPSTRSARRSRRRSRRASGSASRQRPGDTPVTATCTRRSCLPATTSAS